MVREEDAYALAADVMMLRAARGHDVTVAPGNAVWLVRGAVVMLGAFGTGTEQEDRDGQDTEALPAEAAGRRACRL